MLLVSVIIPVYNVEKYIHKCLDSIIAQTYRNWEAILVDDGSPDMCGKICDEYAARECRFKVIHQQNGGVSVARQAGLDNAKGDYIIHCDPDDWIEPEMLEGMLNCAVSYNADMVVCDFILHRNNDWEYQSQAIPANATAKQLMTMIIEGKIHGSCWNKLIKKTATEGIGFFPSNISYCEDMLFNVKVLNQDIKVIYLPKAYYHYKADNSASICNSKESKVILSRLTAITEIERIIDNINQYDMYAIKKSVIESLFITKNYKDFIQTYPEIHKRIINDNSKYRFFTPLGYFMARGLKKNPGLSYRLYRIHIHLIDLIQRIRGRKQ